MAEPQDQLLYTGALVRVEENSVEKSAWYNLPYAKLLDSEHTKRGRPGYNWLYEERNMEWDDYIPAALNRGKLEVVARGNGKVIIDFAGIEVQKALTIAQTVLASPLNGDASRLLINLPCSVLHTRASGHGSNHPVVGHEGAQLPLGQDWWQYAFLVNPTGSTKENISAFERDIDDLLSHYIVGKLLEDTLRAKVQGSQHFFTNGGAHIQVKYMVDPLLKTDVVAEFLSIHVARKLHGLAFDVILPWAETGIQLAYRLKNLLRRSGSTVEYIVPTKRPAEPWRPLIAPQDRPIVTGKRVLLLVDVLCAGEMIAALAEEVEEVEEHLRGFVVGVIGILKFQTSAALDRTVERIKERNSASVRQWLVSTNRAFQDPPTFKDLRHIACVPHLVYSNEEHCNYCAEGSSAVAMFSVDEHNEPALEYPKEVLKIASKDFNLDWCSFWVRNQVVGGIGYIEGFPRQQIDCFHCHDGQVLDTSKYPKDQGLWDSITSWATQEVLDILRARGINPDSEPIHLITSKSRGATTLATALMRRCLPYELQGPHEVYWDASLRMMRGKFGDLPQRAKCILIDDSFFTTDTAMRMLTYAGERLNCEVLGVLTIVYCARGDEHFRLTVAMKEKKLQIRVAFVAGLQWDDLDRCKVHSRFDRFSNLMKSQGGWSKDFQAWHKRRITHTEKLMEAQDTKPKADLLLNRMLRQRQWKWDDHLQTISPELSEKDFIKAVNEWPAGDDPVSLGPEFAVAASDFASKLEPLQAARIVTNLLGEPRSYKLAVGVADLLDSLPEVLCSHQDVYPKVANLFSEYRLDKETGRRTGIDPTFVALFKVLWDANVEKETRLLDALAGLTSADGDYYGTILSTVIASLETVGDARTTLHQLQKLRAGVTKPAQPQRPDNWETYVDQAIQDLNVYVRFLDKKDRVSIGRVAVLSSASPDIQIIDPASDPAVLEPAENTVIIAYQDPRLLSVATKPVVVYNKGGSARLLDVAGLICLSAKGVMARDVRRFLERYFKISDPDSTASHHITRLLKETNGTGAFVEYRKARSPGQAPNKRSPRTVLLAQSWKWRIVDDATAKNITALQDFAKTLR